MIIILIYVANERKSKTNIFKYFCYKCKYNCSLESNILINHIKPNPCKYEGELIQGSEFSDGQYIYRYGQEGDYFSWHNINEDGWGIKLADSESTKKVDTKI